MVGIGVMNIQLAEEYKNAEKGKKERGFLRESEPGLARRGMQLYMNMKRRRD